MSAQDTPVDTTGYVRRLAAFFGLVYFAQGIGQSAGILNQPLNFYLTKGLGLSEEDATNYLAFLIVPWTIKPLYGFVSDFFPLLGNRRRTWLTVMNALATVAFVWLTGLTGVNEIVLAITLAAFGTAASDVIIDAIMVENGDRFNATDRFQSAQWCWINVALVVTALLGGWLCEWLSPAGALHVSAMIAITAPASVIFASWMIVKEEKVSISRQYLVSRTKNLWSGLKSRTLWAVALFLALWYFNPSMGAIWYQHQVKVLGLSQAFIGYLSCATALGGVLGSVLFNAYFRRKTIRYQITFSVVTGVIATLVYLLLLKPGAYTNSLCLVVSFVTGTTSIIAMLSTMGLAARVCPKETAGFTFATLMSVSNTFTMLSSMVGGWLFANLFSKQVAPLIVVSAVFTALCIFLMPLLRGVPATQGGDQE